MPRLKVTAACSSFLMCISVTGWQPPACGPLYILQTGYSSLPVVSLLKLPAALLYLESAQSALTRPIEEILTSTERRLAGRACPTIEIIQDLPSSGIALSVPGSHTETEAVSSWPVQELGKQNPDLLTLINQHQQEFLRIINEPVPPEQAEQVSQQIAQFQAAGMGGGWLAGSRVSHAAHGVAAHHALSSRTSQLQDKSEI